MIDKPIPEWTTEDLDRWFTEANECDKKVFAEMRTNLQLVAGEHYVREGSKFWNRIRDDKRLSNEQKLKLTKNHTQRASKIIRNGILAEAPGVAVTANNESELSDQKSAELNQAYWQFIKRKENIKEKISDWVQHFTDIGEVHVKVFWDPSAGSIIGYKAEMQKNPETGQDEPVIDPQTGQPKQSDEPHYGGKLVFETIEGYNIRRDRDARSLEESPAIGVEKLRPRLSLLALFSDKETREKYQSSKSDETYTVYDNNTSSYRTMKDQAMVRELYWRPGPAIPNGYFFIWTGKHMIAKGELPQGVFPIKSKLYDTQTGNARGHSYIRHGRPAQIEINRCASKIAEHQVTLGDDKIWVQANTKVSQGAMLPGQRVSTYTGAAPLVTQGRTGDQYFSYLESQIDEYYRLVDLQEVNEVQAESADLYTNLFREFRKRRKFSLYGEKFSEFLVDIVTSALEIAKANVSDEELIPIIGKNEILNIPEFKKSEPLCYQIKVEPKSDDIETQFGRQITLNHAIQYIGQSLGKEDIGILLRNSPFLNKDQAFKRFTQKYDRTKNDILAMDRGQFRPPRKYDDHDAYIEALSTRMSEPDFEWLPMPIQMMYERKMEMHEQAKSEQLIEIQRAQAGFIPSGGYLVPCDFYISKDAQDPQKTQRVRVPSEALSWLIDKLKSQGTALEQLQEQPKGVLQDMARLLPPGQNPGGMNAPS